MALDIKPPMEPETRAKLLSDKPLTERMNEFVLRLRTAAKDAERLREHLDADGQKSAATLMITVEARIHAAIGDVSAVNATRPSTRPRPCETAQTCSVCGRDTHQRARGFCRKHYQRFMEHGSPHLRRVNVGGRRWELQDERNKDQ